MPHLRRASRYWPPKIEARKRAERKVKIGEFKNGNPKYETKYECHVCNNLFSREETQVDHIVEVASLTGFDSWDATIARLFCDVDGFGVKCLGCHTSKTAKNQILRRMAKKKAKIEETTWEKSLKKAKKVLAKD